MKGNMEKEQFNESEKQFYQRLGKALRDARRRANKSQSQVAQSINVTFQQVQKYEKATNFPKEYRTMKMVESLGRDYETFKKEYNVYSS
jgi:transcriptional regulator with XRE-family HTH domain|tara:strand:- start:759 stop:1025 length:267 start_codon:yes stop_codon:yes gene_type:complete